MSSRPTALTTIADAGAALRRGATSAVDLLTHSLAVVDARNADLRAFVRTDPPAAFTQARAADAELASGLDRGPLHGMPISLKDLIDVAGTVTTAGSKVLDGEIAAADAEVVTRLRHAGAVLFGKTNLHEFALGTTSEDTALGPIRHPIDRTRVAGGSSGGSAVAVATGMGLASIGSDTGGSIRIPAAACGVVGLKPSIGEVPTAGVVPLSRSLDHVGPLARTVGDAAAVWRALTSRAPATLEPWRTRGLRLSRLRGYFDSPVAPEVRAAFEAALARLVDAGVEIEDAIVAGTDRITEVYVNIVLPEGAHWHAPYLDARKDRYSPTVHARFLNGRAVTAVQYLAAKDMAMTFRTNVDHALDRADALVLPTLPIVAPAIGANDLTIDAAVGDVTNVRAAMLKHTQLFDLSGHPAISIPIPAPGLPVGLQLVGRLDQTWRLLEMAKGCEQALGDRRQALGIRH